MFSVGQRVVCVDDKFRHPPGHGYGDEIFPIKGQVYTIAELTSDHDDGGENCRLVEIRNPLRWYSTKFGPQKWEPCFLLSRFRPVRDTDISIFTKLLNPAPTDKVPA